MNRNCLEGIRCPKCKSEGPFQIDARATFKVYDDGAHEHGDVEWSDDSRCVCVDCGREGTVLAFTKRINPATFSVSPRPGQPKVSVRDSNGKHILYNVSRKVIAVQGKVVFTAKRDTFFGGEDSKDYRSEVMENPTWKQVFAAFKASIPVTRDYHHCFLEGIQRLVLNKHPQKDLDGIPLYEFITGS